MDEKARRRSFGLATVGLVTVRPTKTTKLRIILQQCRNPTSSISDWLGLASFVLVLELGLGSELCSVSHTPMTKPGREGRKEEGSGSQGTEPWPRHPRISNITVTSLHSVPCNSPGPLFFFVSECKQAQEINKRGILFTRRDLLEFCSSFFKIFYCNPPQEKKCDRRTVIIFFPSRRRTNREKIQLFFSLKSPCIDTIETQVE